MNRLLVIGLDGGTDSIIRSSGADLPNLDGMRRDGMACRLRSTVPPVTAAAWPSMFTGWNPGRHGMYDFRAIDIRRPASAFGAGNPTGFAATAEFVSSERWRGAAVWDVAGTSCAVSAVPMTYPPWPVDGVMYAGFPLPDYTRDHAVPASAGGRPPLLERADTIEDMDDAGLAVTCRLLVDRQAERVRGWFGTDEPRLMVAVFQAIDFAQHRLWRYLSYPGHPLREALLGLYTTVDQLVGEARAALGPDSAVVVASDHGFGPHPETLLRTDAALADAGLLAPSRRQGTARLRGAIERSPGLRRRVRAAAARLPAGGRRLADRVDAARRGTDWRATSAFRYPLYGPAEGIAVNLRGRYPHGSVAGSDYERVRDEVIDALTALTDASGAHPVLWARRREEVFQGPYTESAPDVVALVAGQFKPASGLGGVFDPVPRATLDRYSGVHTMDGIFLAAGAGIPAGADLGCRELVDVAPTLLAMLGCPPVEPCDGRSMVGAGDHAARHPVAPAAVDPADDEPMTPDQLETMARSLRSLGYLE